MCPMAHWSAFHTLAGCAIVPGKKYANYTDEEYQQSSTRPFWCPLLPIPDCGRLISAKLLKAEFTGNFRDEYPTALIHALIDTAPTIISEDKEG